MVSGAQGRRVAAVLATLALALVAGVAASALLHSGFTATNNGSGASPVASTSSWVLSSTSLSGIAPGIAPMTIRGTATNASNQTQYIGTVSPTVTGTSNSGCTAADFVVTSGVINTDVASGSTGLNFGTIAFNDTASNQDACQGVTVNLSFTSS